MGKAFDVILSMVETILIKNLSGMTPELAQNWGDENVHRPLRQYPVVQKDRPAGVAAVLLGDPQV